LNNPNAADAIMYKIQVPVDIWVVYGYHHPNILGRADSLHQKFNSGIYLESNLAAVRTKLD